MRDLKRGGGGGGEQRGGGVESLGKFTLISTPQLATSFDTSRRVDAPLAKVPELEKGILIIFSLLLPCPTPFWVLWVV